MATWILVVVTMVTMSDQRVKVYSFFSKKDCHEQLMLFRAAPKKVFGGVAFCTSGVAWSGFYLEKGSE